jgi:hypothetical protein
MEGAVNSRVGDLISISSAPPVVSMSEVEAVRADLRAGRETAGQMAGLIGEYSLADPDSRAAFDVILESLTEERERGDAFHIQGVYGAGKSHLLAVLSLLCGCSEQAWPAFLEAHPEYASAPQGLGRGRLVVPIALDEYPAHTHPLEYVVLSRLEAELARSHEVRVALTQESYLLELVERYVLPQVGGALDEAAREAQASGWQELRDQAPDRAAEVAVEFVRRVQFPLDWRRSRAEAWAELRRALRSHEIGGPVILLDELGTFLACKDRRGLNADASFLQYLAQRAHTSPCWLICVTQRGFEEVGDVDHRTLRQLRDRFRSGLTLDLSDLQWVIQHKVARRRDPAAFAAAMDQLAERYGSPGDEELLSAPELSASYPINPLCLVAIRRAAETCLSRTRSAVRLLQEAALRHGWLDKPDHRLITPDVAFDLFRDEMALTVSGRRHVDAYEAVMGNAARIARGNERRLSIAMKTLCLLGLGELRWSERQLRASLVGGEDQELWSEPGILRDMLLALYRRGAYVERIRREGDEADEYYADVASDSGERLRQRVSEIVGDLSPADSRVVHAALGACRDAAFPIAGAVDPHTIGVMWLNGRRQVTMICRDLCDLSQTEVQNLVGSLESPHTSEDAQVFLALSTANIAEQKENWLAVGGEVTGRFSVVLLAWLPGELGEAEREHLIEHAALAAMVTDRTLFRRRDNEFRDRVRQRWADSETEARRILQRAYYEGSIIGLDGQEVVQRDRLWGLFGDWGATLTEILQHSFRRLFPRFESIAPERRLVGRAQTNQLIDRFIRQGEAILPPASTLEAHILALAKPLGLAAGEDRHLRLSLQNRELVQTAIRMVPPRSMASEVDPDEALRYAELVGRIAKSEWGLVPEQGELLVAALIRTGYLVGLDAFLQPARLDAVAAPLGDSLPYVMRGEALAGEVADQAVQLWQAAVGAGEPEWDLPTQEHAWDEILAWAARLSEASEQNRTTVRQAAQQLGHGPEDWARAEQALATAEALAGGTDSSLTSKQGLAAAVEAAQRLPGGIQQTADSVERWRECARFFERDLAGLYRLRQMMTDARVQCPEGSLLARERRSTLAQFAAAERLVSDTEAVKAAAHQWLENYRRHYLAWHSSAHAAAIFDDLATLRREATMQAAQRLAQSGLDADDIRAIEGELSRELARRCLAGDPLPAGSVVCPICSIKLGEELALPQPQQLRERLQQALAAQCQELGRHADLLRRRLAGCTNVHVREAVEKLLPSAAALTPEELNSTLSDDVVAWLRRQLGRPKASRRSLSDLQSALQGKELTRREVMRIVDEWLQAGEDEVVEIV